MTNQSFSPDWVEIPRTRGRYSAGVSSYVENPNKDNDLVLADRDVLDGYLSLHLRQQLGGNDGTDDDAGPSHGVAVKCHYFAYVQDLNRVQDLRLLVDWNDDAFLLQFNELNVDDWYTWCVTPLLCYAG